MQGEPSSPQKSSISLEGKSPVGWPSRTKVQFARHLGVSMEAGWLIV
jgi:hypothetical protein